MIEFPRVESGEDVTISATTYVTWRRCPQSANARLQGHYSPPTPRGFVGGLAHRLFARSLNSGSLAIEDLESVCREEIGSASHLNRSVAELGLKPSTLGPLIQEACQLYERFTAVPTDGCAGAEVALEATPAEGVVLRGQIDAVFAEDSGETRLTDWKTGEVGDVDDQLDFYVLLWALVRDEIPGAVEAVSVKTGERTRAVPTRSRTERTASQVAELVSTMRRAWSTGADLERIGGPGCRFCPLLDDCSEGAAAVSVLDAVTPAGT